MAGDPAYDLVDAGGWTEFRSSAHRIRVTHPNGWRVLDQQIDLNKTNPVGLLVVSNFEIPDGGYCALAPAEALHSLPEAGIFITVYERLPEESDPEPTIGFDPKPARFGPWLGSVQSSVTECLEDPSPFSHWFLNFRIADRAFHVLVVFGPRTPPSTQAAAWHVLDSFGTET